MFKLYRYYDIIEMEDRYADKFADLNPTRKIAILPPIFRKVNRKLFLAYPVISQPKYENGHAGITRPIGFIIRNRKTGEILQLESCANFDFAPNKPDFKIEYYDLEMHPNYWPNRTNENEERYRTALEKLYKTNRTINIFGKINQTYYQAYINDIKTFFTKRYWQFYEYLEVNNIVEVDEKLKAKRKKSEEEHEQKMQEINLKTAVEQAFEHEKLVKETKEKIIDFVKKEVLPTLKNKGDATRILFYNELGKIFKNLFTDLDCKNCYDTRLTPAARKANAEKLLSQLKIDIIKKFSRACVTPLNTITAICNTCKTMIIFLNTMMIEEIKQEVTDKSKETIEKCINTLNKFLSQVSNNQIREEFSDIAELLCRDYYEVTDERDLSDLYVGYSTVNKVYSVQLKIKN